MSKKKNTWLNQALWVFLGVILSVLGQALVSSNFDLSKIATEHEMLIFISICLIIIVISLLVLEQNIKDMVYNNTKSNSKISTVISEYLSKDDNDKSTCYGELIDMVNKATKSILIIPNPYNEGEIDTWEKKPRKNLFESIENKLKSAKANNKAFEYLRIQQVPKQCGSDIKKMEKYIGNSAMEHMKKVSEIDYDRASLMYIHSSDISGQMIIDGEICIKFITGLDKDGVKRLVAVSIMKDPTNDAIEQHCSRLSSILKDKSTEFKLTE